MSESISPLNRTCVIVGNQSLITRLPHLLNVVEDESMNTKVSRQDMGKWIGDAWDKITPKTIKKTSRKIGFTDSDV
jgi:hypothetical protein